MLTDSFDSRTNGASPMTSNDQCIANGALANSEQASPLTGWIESVRSHLMAWIETSADYYAAAAIYEELSGLSDTELTRRGLSRENLARDVCSVRGRNAGA